jgi:sugar/nucleoside kinase (ribokinase family)
MLVIGDVGVDLVMGPVGEWPTIGTEVIVDRSEMRLGGSAGNTFLAARLLGAPCRVISATGSDLFGSWLAEQIEAVGGSVGRLDGPTSLTAGIIHQCGERSFFTTKGHLERLSWDDLSGLLPEATEGDIVIMTGVFLLPRLRATYPSLLRELRANGFQIALDTGWPSEGWSAAVRDEVLSWIALSDHILLNEAEIVALTETDNVEQALSALASSLREDATLVVKTGPDGAIGMQGGICCAATAPKVTPFDTIGAGDSFNAGYLYARLAGQDLRSALEAGCKTASRIISRFPRAAMRPGELAP